MSGEALPVDTAVRLILERLQPMNSEQVPLAHALGRTLSDDVVAGVDLPHWDNSSMDGYACRAADVAQASEAAPIQLPVTETIAAGAFASRPLRAKEAMRIMTGAPLPEGADTVVRVEDTDGGLHIVSIRTARDALANIRRRGEDVRTGDRILRAGSRIGAAEMALLAAVDTASIPVHRRPRVAVLSTGDELVAVGDSGAAGSRARIVSANSYSLAAIVTEAGGEAVDLGIVPDDLDATAAAMEEAQGCDLLLTSGGISVGGFDYTRRAVEAAGGEVLFWRVAMRPGYNSGFGSVHGVPWLGVPGNPVSALIAGEVLVRPAVRRLCGSTAPLRARRRVALAERHRGGKGVTVFMRVTLEETSDGTTARSAGPQGSAILSSSTRANGLLLIPPEAEDLEPGDPVDALILRDDARD